MGLDRGLILGLVLGAALMQAAFLNFWGLSVEEFEKCLMLCDSHGGLEVVYSDNDCECRNGLQIDPSDYKVNHGP